MHSQCKYILVTSVLNQISKQLKFGFREITKYDQHGMDYYKNIIKLVELKVVWILRKSSSQRYSILDNIKYLKSINFHHSAMLVLRHKRHVQ